MTSMWSLNRLIGSITSLRSLKSCSFLGLSRSNSSSNSLRYFLGMICLFATLFSWVSVRFYLGLHELGIEYFVLHGFGEEVPECYPLRSLLVVGCLNVQY